MLNQNLYNENNIVHLYHSYLLHFQAQLSHFFSLPTYMNMKKIKVTWLVFSKDHTCSTLADINVEPFLTFIKNL